MPDIPEEWNKDIRKLHQASGGDVCEALIGMHAFTGCDTVSAFADWRTVATLKTTKSDKTYQGAFSALGHSWEVRYLRNSSRGYRSPVRCIFFCLDN